MPKMPKVPKMPKIVERTFSTIDFFLIGNSTVLALIISFVPKQLSVHIPSYFCWLP